ncbi:MAG: putative kinase [Cirrosporium novae-zelandiae]|nr:MAG: putative kinase [Cirrosporium novae-zelandiae]
MDAIYSVLTERARKAVRQLSQSEQRRAVIALAGPPGSGKSTIAAKVVKNLNDQATRPFAVSVPMDGFHLSRATLDKLPNRDEAYARRGAPWTFDADGVLDLVQHLCTSRALNIGTILAPSFDHVMKDPVKDAILIPEDFTLVILEGNYLLLDREPWRQINELVDDTWFVDVAPDLARERIAKRHIKSGIELDWTSAIARAESNDILNGAEIRKYLIKPCITVQSVNVR